MNIIIIGGTQFIGPYVVRELVSRGHSVTVFHRGKSQAELPSSVQHILGDRHNINQNQSQLRAMQPQVMLDMIPLNAQDAQDVVSVFRGVAERLVMISSMDVYRAYGRLTGTEPGSPDPMPLTEESPLREKLYPYRGEKPRAEDDPERRYDDYDKIPAEKAVLSQPDLPGTVLRLPAVYGPGDKQHRLFSYLKRMDDGRKAIILGAGLADWRWTRGYVVDVAHAIVLAVVDGRAAGQVYNVGEPSALREQDWVRAIAQAAGWEGQVVVLPDEQVPAHLKFEGDTRQDMAASTEKIRQQLGYQEKTDPQESLRRTLAWERAHPPEFNPTEFDYGVEDRVLGD